GKQQLIEFGHVAVREYHCLAVSASRVGNNSRSNVVDCELVNVFGDSLKGVPVGEHLVVGNYNKGLNSQILQAHAVLQRTKEVPYVESACRPVAGEYAEACGLCLELGFEFAASFKACLECSVVELFFAHGGSPCVPACQIRSMA